jgi:hypothetical protein
MHYNREVIMDLSYRKEKSPGLADKHQFAAVVALTALWLDADEAYKQKFAPILYQQVRALSYRRYIMSVGASGTYSFRLDRGMRLKFGGLRQGRYWVRLILTARGSPLVCFVSESISAVFYLLPALSGISDGDSSSISCVPESLLSNLASGVRYSVLLDEIGAMVLVRNNITPPRFDGGRDGSLEEMLGVFRSQRFFTEHISGAGTWHMTPHFFQEGMRLRLRDSARYLVQSYLENRGLYLYFVPETGRTSAFLVDGYPNAARNIHSARSPGAKKLFFDAPVGARASGLKSARTMVQQGSYLRELFERNRRKKRIGFPKRKFSQVDQVASQEDEYASSQERELCEKMHEVLARRYPEDEIKVLLHAGSLLDLVPIDKALDMALETHGDSGEKKQYFLRELETSLPALLAGLQEFL